MPKRVCIFCIQQIRFTFLFKQYVEDNHKKLTEMFITVSGVDAADSNGEQNSTDSMHQENTIDSCDEQKTENCENFQENFDEKW